MSKRKDLVVTVYLGVREEVINGQTILVKRFKQLDLDQGIDFEQALNDICSANEERKSRARKAIRDYKNIRILRGQTVGQ